MGVLVWMSVGLLFYVLFMLVLCSFYVFQNTKILFIVNFFVMVVSIGGFYGVYLVGFGVNGFVLVYLFLFVLVTVFGLFVLIWDIQGIGLRAILLSIVKICVVCILMVVVVWLTFFVVLMDILSNVMVIVEVVVGVGVGLGVYVFVVYVLNIVEVC